MATSGCSSSSASTSSGRDVHARRLDRVAQPTGEEQVTVGVETSGVAGAVPAVGGEHVGTLALVDAVHQRVAAHPHLADLAGCHVGAGLRIDDAVLDAGHLTPEAALLVGRKRHVALERVRAQGLGHAQRRGPRPRWPAQLGGGERGGGAGADRRQVAAGVLGMVGERLAHVRPPQHLRHPLSLEQRQRRARLEPLLEHDGGAGVHGGEQ